MNELVERISSLISGGKTSPAIHAIRSTDDHKRGYSVRQEVESLASKYQAGHVIALCTHAAMLMSDFRHFAGWHIVIDEVPNVLMIGEKQTKLDLAFFAEHYTLTPVHGCWSAVSATKAGLAINGSDLQQDDSHRHLRVFHQRVLDSGKPSMPHVVCNLRSWDDMAASNVQWTWWTLFSIRQLEAFATIRMLGNGFMQSVAAKTMQAWDKDVVWKVRSTKSTRGLTKKHVTIRYFSHRGAAKSFFESATGQKHLDAIARYVAGQAPDDSLIWSCNAGDGDVILDTLGRHLPGSAYLTPRQAGSDRHMHCHHAAMIYAAKPSANVRDVLAAIPIAKADWIASNEHEVILQFVTRTSIRDVTTGEDATVYVYNDVQAEYLARFFASQPHIDASLEFVELDLPRAEPKKPGPKTKTLSPEEEIVRAAADRANRTRAQKERRAEAKLARRLRGARLADEAKKANLG